MVDSRNAAKTISLFCRLNTRSRVVKPLRAGEIGLLFYLDSDNTVHTSVAAATFFMISKPAVSRMVMNLEKKDLISRKRSETDARVIELHVTDKGREVIKTVSDVYRRRTEKLREKIGTEEFDHFIELMDQANGIIAEELGIQQ